VKAYAASTCTCPHAPVGSEAVDTVTGALSTYMAAHSEPTSLSSHDRTASLQTSALALSSPSEVRRRYPACLRLVCAGRWGCQRNLTSACRALLLDFKFATDT
jgi:hypothetical protein